MSKNNTIIGINERPPLSQWLFLSLQHVAAMFGATVLVPILTGLSISTALFTAGIGTLIYILVTDFKVPVFLGSSFAFIPAIITIANNYGIQYATGGIFVAGLFYVLIASIIKFTGTEWIDQAFSPVVIGSVIIVIGMSLAPTAINEAFYLNNQYSLVSLSIATVTLIIAIVSIIFLKGFFNTLSILIGLIGGYLFTFLMGLAFPQYQIINFSSIKDAKWLAWPFFDHNQWLYPKFNLVAILTFTIVSISTICEHMGDILTTSKVVGKDFYRDPGLHRTLLGDGIATSLAGIFAGPANTTYGENISVLLITKVYSVWVIIGAAIITIILSFCQKFSAAIQTIPTPVLGGISILLYGLIAASGLKTMIDSNVDFKKRRNLIISSVILVIGCGGGLLQFIVKSYHFNLSAVALSSLLGILLNLVIPRKEANF